MLINKKNKENIKNISGEVYTKNTIKKTYTKKNIKFVIFYLYLLSVPTFFQFHLKVILELCN